ncbi:MAG TPA: biotin--[acetyl-CoA-carboxylase] ligase [Firmicutes bacterium]|nr:biotin--[acetyl-CoA-carboxylase] ligase [Bacillota bacterium]
MNISAIAEILKKSHHDWEIEFLPSIDSTNTELSRRFSKSAVAPFFVLCADEQTAGRGRMERQWYSVPSADITASLIFPSPVSKSDTPKLALSAGLALVEVLESDFRLEAKLRWPNDVMTTRGKLAGILCAYLNIPDAVITGIGINVNSAPDAFPLGPDRSNSTIRHELGYEVEREQLLANWILSFESKWKLARKEMIDELKNEFDRFNFYLGRKVKILVGAASSRDDADDKSFDEIEGIAGGLDDSGELVVVRGDGSLYAVSIEDVIEPLE